MRHLSPDWYVYFVRLNIIEMMLSIDGARFFLAHVVIHANDGASTNCSFRRHQVTNLVNNR